MTIIYWIFKLAKSKLIDKVKFKNIADFIFSIHDSQLRVSLIKQKNFFVFVNGHTMGMDIHMNNI